MLKIYCTSFCNFGHDLKDGKPIAHECYTIPPAFLKAERDGNDWPEGEREQWSKKRRTHRGKWIRTAVLQSGDRLTAICNVYNATIEEVFRRAAQLGLVCCKHNDPTETARRDLTLTEARDVAAQDPGLLYFA